MTRQEMAAVLMRALGALEEAHVCIMEDTAKAALAAATCVAAKRLVQQMLSLNRGNEGPVPEQQILVTSLEQYGKWVKDWLVSTGRK